MLKFWKLKFSKFLKISFKRNLLYIFFENFWLHDLLHIFFGNSGLSLVHTEDGRSRHVLYGKKRMKLKTKKYKRRHKRLEVIPAFWLVVMVGFMFISLFTLHS